MYNGVRTTKDPSRNYLLFPFKLQLQKYSHSPTPIAGCQSLANGKEKLYHLWEESGREETKKNEIIFFDGDGKGKEEEKKWRGEREKEEIKKNLNYIFWW